MERIEIITVKVEKVGKVWDTFTTSRGTTVITLDPNFTREEAEAAVKEVKALLKEVKIKAEVSYYWSNASEKPMKVSIKVTAKELNK